MIKTLRELLNRILLSRYFYFIQLLAMAIWGAQLLNTDSYYVNYLLLLIFVAICVYENSRNSERLFHIFSGKYQSCILCFFSFLFSSMILFANYKLWDFTDKPEEFGYTFMRVYKACLMLTFFCGGFFAFSNVFYVAIKKCDQFFWRRSKKPVSSQNVFWISFFLLVITRLLVLFLCQYPGELTPDSMSQMSQAVDGKFSNHHPFYHTLVIKCFVDIGMALFNDINAAVATYSFFQVIFTAMCFSFAVSTMAMMVAPRWIIALSILFYVFMPYHIVYAITMWKDIMFGCFVLLLIVTSYRCLMSLGNHILNYVLLSFSGLGVCLFRSNGYFVFAISAISYLVCCMLKNRKMIVIFTVTLVIAFFMKHTVLEKIGVTQPDTIEALSIPAQQIARVVHDGCELTEWEWDALSEIIDIEEISDHYSAYISDPIKDLVRAKGNQQLILDKKSKYIKLYVSLGLRYPREYLLAWIDQTRGYWNAGYDYWIWDLDICENSLSIERTIRSGLLDRMLKEYLWLFTNVEILRLFLSVGLFVWIDIMMLMVALLRKDKAGVFISLPILAVVSSLLVATPVFSELRYIYSVFCALPIIVVIVLRPSKLAL